MVAEVITFNVMNPYFNKEALQFLENKMLPNMIFLL